MAVETTSGRKFTIERICLRAYQSIGLMSIHQGTSDASWPDRREYAIDMLQILVNNLQAYDVQARLGGFAEVAVSAADVTAQVYKFDLPSTVLDVIGDAKWIEAGEDTERASSETLVKLINRDEWQRIGSRSSSGRPTRFYTHRESDTLQAWVWPLPDGAGTLRFEVQRKIADITDGSATVDLEDYWVDYLIKALAGRLAAAAALPMDKTVPVNRDAETALIYARGRAEERGMGQIRCVHRTPWH